MRSLGVISILCLCAWTRAGADVFENEQQLAATRERLAADYHTASLPLMWYFKTDPEDRGVQERWFSASPRDTSWARIRADERWENRGYEGYDGFAWYMCRVQIPDDWTQFFVRFPSVDDAYILYVNGQEVCRDGDRFRSLWQWSSSHEITDFVQPGKEATIILRVEDYAGFGGLVRGPGELLNFSGQIDVSTGWRFCPDDLNVGVARGWHDTRFDDSSWRLMDAGRNWESYGYDFDGFGWYRRWVVGHEPSYGRQSVKYQYNIGGQAWSGSPTIVGPGLWSTDPVDGWSLGVWLHEVGHNFNWQTPVDKIVFGPLDGWYHHFVEALIQYVLHYSIEHPEQFALSGEKLATYREHVNRVRAHAYQQYHDFQTWVKDNDNAADFPGDRYAAWKGLLIELVDTFGCQTLERCLRAVRTDGVPRQLRESADTVEKKNSLIFCILSHAAGSDLRDLFRRDKFRFDEVYYNQIDGRIAEILSHLPNEDVRGWKRNPTTGHYYRRTPFEMTWCEAEDYAQSVGGHLACIENESELSWLCSRFEIYGQAWIGLYRDESGAWRRFTRGRPWQPTWHDGYPVRAQDHSYAALDLVAGKMRNRSDLDALFGIMEVEELTAIDDPGFTVIY